MIRVYKIIELRYSTHKQRIAMAELDFQGVTLEDVVAYWKCYSVVDYMAIHYDENDEIGKSLPYNLIQEEILERYEEGQNDEKNPMVAIMAIPVGLDEKHVIPKDRYDNCFCINHVGVLNESSFRGISEDMHYAEEVVNDMLAIQLTYASEGKAVE